MKDPSPCSPSITSASRSPTASSGCARSSAFPTSSSHYDRDPQTRGAPAEYRALTPFGTAPVITDGDLTMGESGALVEYIIQTYGDGRLTVRPGAAGYADYLFWFHFGNGSLMPAAMMEMAAQRTGGSGMSIPGVPSRLDRAYDQLEARLGEVPYLAGAEFTAADIMNLFPLTTMRLFGPRDLSPNPNIRAYLQRIGERPAFRRAMEKADPGLEIPLS